MAKGNDGREISKVEKPKCKKKKIQLAGVSDRRTLPEQKELLPFSPFSTGIASLLFSTCTYYFGIYTGHCSTYAPGPQSGWFKEAPKELKVEKTSYWNSRMSEETPFQNNFDDLLHKPTSNTISETLSNVDVSNPFKDAISPLFAP
ncbi:16341_t:CDS:2, partial [Acaulospora morrowiae]